MSVHSAIEWTDDNLESRAGLHQNQPRLQVLLCRAIRSNGFEECPDTLSSRALHLRLVRKSLADPLRWQSPRRIFVNSMSDLFHPQIPDSFVVQSCSRSMMQANWHTYQILTKRAERLERLLSGRTGICRSRHPTSGGASASRTAKHGKPRIERLRQPPAAIRFLSWWNRCWRTLEKIDLTEHPLGDRWRRKRSGGAPPQREMGSRPS